MKELWKKFDDLSNDCYLEEIDGPKNLDIWMKTYAALKQALSWEREHNPEFPTEYDEFDCALDDMWGIYYGVEDWVLDFFDELELFEDWEEVIAIANEIMNLFDWEEMKADEFKVRIARALVCQEKLEEAVEYCKEWYQEDKDSISAATSFIYSLIEIKDFAQAENIVEQRLYYETVQITFDEENPSDIHYETVANILNAPCFEDVEDIIECNDVNYPLFLAAHTLYMVQEKHEKAEEISREIEEYDAKMEHSMENFEPFDFGEWGEELPF